MRFLTLLCLLSFCIACSAPKKPVASAPAAPAESQRKPMPKLAEEDSIPVSILRGYQYNKALSGKDSVTYFLIQDAETFQAVLRSLPGRDHTPVSFPDEVVIGAYRTDMKPLRYQVANVSLKNNELKVELSSKMGMSREAGAVPGVFAKFKHRHFNRVVFLENGKEMHKELYE